MNLAPQVMTVTDQQSVCAHTHTHAHSKYIQKEVVICRSGEVDCFMGVVNWKKSAKSNFQVLVNQDVLNL